MNKISLLILTLFFGGLTANNNPSTTNVDCLVKMSDQDIRNELSKKDPLFLACFEGKLDQVKSLIAQGSSPTIRANTGSINTLTEATLVGLSRSFRRLQFNKNHSAILSLLN